MKITKYSLFAFGAMTIMASAARAQQPAKARNLVVLRIDGYRWRGRLEGADSSIHFDQK
ncbi:MAG: hypothetical protein Q8938_17020 [Bacteroidota bacterium]|nr:hypothetical protein [Bacteroidota bacterium]